MNQTHIELAILELLIDRHNRKHDYSTDMIMEEIGIEAEAFYINMALITLKKRGYITLNSDDNGGAWRITHIPQPWDDFGKNHPELNTPLTGGNTLD